MFNWLKVLKSILFLVYISLIILIISGSQRIGISWDEPFHTSRLNERLKYGWNFPFFNYKFDFIVPSYADLYDYRVHGLSFQFVSHILNVLLGQEEWLEVSNSLASVEGRHLLSALLGIATSIICGLIFFILTRNIFFSFFCSFSLLAIPVFNGHSMFNPKDIPVAFAVTLSAFVLIYSWKILKIKEINNLKLFILFALQITWIFIGVGTRFAFWTYILIHFIFYVVFYVNTKTPLTLSLKLFITLLLGTCVGLISVFLLHTDLLIDIKLFFTESIYNSADFGSGSLLLYLGNLTEPPSTRLYLISHILIHLPIAFFFILFLFTYILRKNFDNIYLLLKDNLLPFVILSLLGIAPVFIAILINSKFYDADRHILFLYPFVSIFITLFFYISYLYLQSFISRVMYAGAYTLFLLPILAQISLFPYSYTYVNEFGLFFNSDKSITGWETDYWGTSLREGQEKLENNILFHCSSDTHFRIEKFTDQSHCENLTLPIQEFGYIYLSPKRENYSPPMGCFEYNSTFRSFLGYKYQMNYIFLCNESM